MTTSAMIDRPSQVPNELPSGAVDSPRNLGVEAEDRAHDEIELLAVVPAHREQVGQLQVETLDLVRRQWCQDAVEGLRPRLSIIQLATQPWHELGCLREGFLQSVTDRLDIAHAVDRCHALVVTHVAASLRIIHSLLSYITTGKANDNRLVFIYE